MLWTRRLQSLRKSSPCSPRASKTTWFSAQLYTVKHQQAKAEEQFKIAQDIEPESEEVVLNLARLYVESGDIEHAAKLIEAVPENDRTAPHGVCPGGGIRPVEAHQGRYRGLQARRRSRAGDVHTHEALGQALLNDNQFDAALKQYRNLQTPTPRTRAHWFISRRFSAVRANTTMR